MAQIINVFFDESGKRKEKPNLMGGLSIPLPLYQSPAFEQLSQKLRDGELKLHWTKYNGHSDLRVNITETINILSNFQNMIKFFVIN